MKKFFALLFCTSLLFAACDDDDDNGNEDTMIDVLVCMRETEDARAIVAMSLDGQEDKVLILGVLAESDWPKQGSIGSDGVTLLYSGNKGGVKMLNLASKVKKTLIDEYDDDNKYEVPVFSPDMKTVYVMDRNDNDAYCSIDVATGSKTILDDENRLTYGSFSADGKTMVVSYDWGYSIATMKPDGTDLVLIKEEGSGTEYYHPMCVPSLGKVIYVKEASNLYSICICDMDGTDEITLVSQNIRLSSPTVSADGSKVAYFLGNKESGAIVVAEFNGTVLSNSTQFVSITGNTTWRPQFNRMDKSVYDNATNSYVPEEEEEEEE